MTTINLRPIQTGDACYLTDHHNRDGECIITVTMSDGCSTLDAATAAIAEAANAEERIPSRLYFNNDDMYAVVKWCAEQWQLAQADMPAAADRDNEGGDESERYLECHILATWAAA